MSAHLPIAKHELIGDLRSIALVGTGGIIDYMSSHRWARNAASTTPSQLRCAGDELRTRVLRAGYPHHVHAIPAKSKRRARVVIPTISRRTHLRPNSCGPRREELVWGTRGRRFESCLPDRRATRVRANRLRGVLGAGGRTGCSALTRNDGFSCERHHSAQVRPDAAVHT